MHALTYEQAMAALEEVVRKLDQGELPLEDAISSFQDGLEYIKICQAKLDAAEGKLAMFRNGQFEVQ
ncbi:MAG: exodeoxyribonuclease VII small subunit [Peptococcaceae bacterium]|nr:exodeoxyribonuclease VII small subunit [Peptococcaceae bacterium]